MTTNLNEDLGKAKLIHTEQGVYINAEELRRLEKKRREAEIEDELEAKPKTFEQAKRLAREDPQIRAEFADRPPRIAPYGR